LDSFKIDWGLCICGLCLLGRFVGFIDLGTVCGFFTVCAFGFSMFFGNRAKLSAVKGVFCGFDVQMARVFCKPFLASLLSQGRETSSLSTYVVVVAMQSSWVGIGLVGRG